MSTWSGQVSASANDATQTTNEKEGVVSITSTLAEWASTGGVALIGLRFQNVLIPKGASIDKIELELFGTNTATATGFNVYMASESNAPAFKAETGNLTQPYNWTTKTNGNLVSGYTWTASYNLFTFTAAGSDLCARMQSVMALAGWAEGNAIALFLNAITSKTEKVAMWDKESGAKSAKIKVTYKTLFLQSFSLSQSTTPALPIVVEGIKSTTQETTPSRKLLSIGETRGLAVTSTPVLVKGGHLSKPLEVASTLNLVKSASKTLEFLQQEFALALGSAQQHAVKVTQAQSPSLVRNSTHTVPAISQGQTVGLTKLPNRLFAIAQEAISAITNRGLSLHIPILQGTLATPFKFIKYKTLSVIQSIEVFVFEPQKVEIIILAIIAQNTSVKFEKFTEKVLLVPQEVVSVVNQFHPKEIPTIVQSIVAQAATTAQPLAFRLSQSQLVGPLGKVPGKVLALSQETLSSIGRAQTRTLAIGVGTIVNNLKAFLYKLPVVQRLTLTFEKLGPFRNSSSGSITWIERNDHLINVETDLRQYEGKIIPGTPDKLIFSLKKEPLPIKAKDGTTSDPQWQ